MRVRIIPGGPMLVDGLGLTRLVHDGDRWRTEPIEAPGSYALCRCGRSGSMPLCDREEPYVCFEEEPPGGPPPGPFRWDVPDPDAPGLALKPNGPVRISGGLPISYDGRDLPTTDRVSLCRCGASRCQPLCDSSHKIVGYRD